LRAEAEHLESEAARHTDGARRARELRAKAEDLEERAAQNMRGEVRPPRNGAGPD